MDALSTLPSLGLDIPTPAYIAGAILFGILGIAAWRIGKRNGRPVAKWLGVALMFYPYAIDRTWLLYLVGTALTAAALFDLR